MHTIARLCFLQCSFRSCDLLCISTKKRRQYFERSFANSSENTKADAFVCIVGAGPAGYYAADVLIRSGANVQIDFVERLPSPFGLLRYGVAPDHPEIKLPLCQKFTELLERYATRVSYFGNVTVGRDVSVSELQRLYHAVILAAGANRDKWLGVPGESLKGIFAARHFVHWYNAFPFPPRSRHCQSKVDATVTVREQTDITDRDEEREAELVRRLTTESVAHVIGMGNVALDVTRMLLQPVEALRHTDVSQPALEVLARSTIREVHLIARRGPLQAACTTKELREVTRLEGCTTLLAQPLHTQLTESDREELKSRPKQRFFQLLQSIEQNTFTSTSITTPRKVILHFLQSPDAFLSERELNSVGADDSVGGIRLVRNIQQGPPFQQYAVPAVPLVSSIIPSRLVFRAIGYTGVPLPGVPFDEKRGVVPHVQGRVVTVTPQSQHFIPGLYVTGWLKRGATGVIGTNKDDAEETIASLLEDMNKGKLLRPLSPFSARENLRELLRSRGVRTVSFEEWKLIERAEKMRGLALQKPAEKFIDVNEMLAVLESSG
jgi:NADPH-dependent glutamate synthase beta subunit-like oxidoreductase